MPSTHPTATLPPPTAGTLRRPKAQVPSEPTRSGSIQLPVVNWPAPLSPRLHPPPPPLAHEEPQATYPTYSPDYPSHSFTSLSPDLSLQFQNFDNQLQPQLYPGEYFDGSGSDDYSDPSPPPNWSSPETPTMYGGITLPSLVPAEYPAPLDMTSCVAGLDMIDIPALPSLDMYHPDQASYFSYF